MQTQLKKDYRGSTAVKVWCLHELFLIFMPATHRLNYDKTLSKAIPCSFPEVATSPIGLCTQIPFFVFSPLTCMPMLFMLRGTFQPHPTKIQNFILRKQKVLWLPWKSFNFCHLFSSICWTTFCHVLCCFKRLLWWLIHCSLPVKRHHDEGES